MGKIDAGRSARFPCLSVRRSPRLNASGVASHLCVLFSLRPPTPHANTEATCIKLAYLLNASVGIVRRTQPSVCQQWVGFLCFLRPPPGFSIRAASLDSVYHSFIHFLKIKPKPKTRNHALFFFPQYVFRQPKTDIKCFFSRFPILRSIFQIGRNWNFFL